MVYSCNVKELEEAEKLGRLDECTLHRWPRSPVVSVKPFYDSKPTIINLPLMVYNTKNRASLQELPALNFGEK